MKAYELLNSPDKWIQGDLSMNHTGDITTPSLSSTCKWCAYGAILKCYTEDELTQVLAKLREYIMANNLGSIPGWNDTNTYETVVGKLRELDI